MSTTGHINWQTRASMAYQWTEGQEIAGLQAELSRRIEGLIGYTVEKSRIQVHRDKHQATVVVDGVIFRLLRRTLVVLRPCTGCGTGYYQSPEIGSLPDLGYALRVHKSITSRSGREAARAGRGWMV